MRYLLLFSISAGLLLQVAHDMTGVRLVSNATKPTCEESNRATMWSTRGGAGVADVVEVCDKTAADTYAWRPLISTSSGGSVPTGGIIMVVSGACPTGFTEETALDGKFVLGTLDGGGDVGDAGGSDNITPAGTNSTPTFAGSALAGHGHTFTGSAMGTHLHGAGTYATSAHSGTAVTDHASHTHTYTDVPNHVHVQNFPNGFTGGSAYMAPDTAVNGSTASYLSTANPTGGVATGTTAGPSATLTHSVTQPSAHTMSGSSEAISAGTPAGTLDSVSGGTPAGTVTAPTFTGNSFDNRPAFVKVIFCRAN